MSYIAYGTKRNRRRSRRRRRRSILTVDGKKGGEEM
jgi:hypothetical protein